MRSQYVLPLIVLAAALCVPGFAPVRYVPVVVQAGPAGGARAAAAVRHVGGRVTRDLPIVGGVAATVPAARVAALAAAPGVRAVSRDGTVRPQAEPDPAVDAGPADVVRDVVGATAAHANGVTGTGVTVALVDTGVADLPELAGRVVPVYDDVRHAYAPCVNLSGERGCGDSYGHGTFMAGLIAGSGTTYGGIAPGAQIVSLKIAGRDGSADVSNVLAAIQWAVSFRDRYGIRVLNLSLGTDGTQSYRSDPLDYAVERAWAAGIVVVTSASNRGPAAGTIAKPGDDPWVVTAGAVDDRGTVDLADDTLPDFSGRGPTAADGLAKPDLVAPGAHVVSLRAPGSAIDVAFPSSLGGAYRRGSGTSMAAAVVSGVAALYLDADPTATPDRVKFALTATARPDASNDPYVVGSGVVDVQAALLAPPGLANAGLARSTGLGPLDLSRGSLRVRAGNLPRTVVSGSLTLQLLLWNPVSYTTLGWTSLTWYGSAWYGSAWYGSAWYGSAWYGSAWYGSSWYGAPDGSAWYGSAWYGSAWYGGWS